MQQRLRIEASQTRHTPGGDFLGKLYYSTRFLDDTLGRDEHTGYPHNGGQHTLTLYMTPVDLSAWLNLLDETYPSQRGRAEFVSSVREKFAKRYPMHQLM